MHIYNNGIFDHVKAHTQPLFRFGKEDLWVLVTIVIQIICSVYIRSQNFFWDDTRDSLSWLGYSPIRHIISTLGEICPQLFLVTLEISNVNHL